MATSERHARGWLSETSKAILKRGVYLADLTDGPGVNFLGLTPYSPESDWLEFDRTIEKFQVALDDENPIFPFKELSDKEKQVLGAVYISSDWAEDQFQLAMMKEPTKRQLSLFRVKYAVQAIEKRLALFDVPFKQSSFNKSTDAMGCF